MKRRMSEAQYTAFPPAKINLHLRVLGKRPDGYHEIETIFQTVSLVDELAVSLRPGGSLSLEVAGDSTVPSSANNLCLQAASRFAQAAGLSFGGKILLRKRIPAGAGLGGGSSDAAALLRILNRHFGEPLRDGQLARVARGLGADVPFFLRGGTAIGRGIGDELEFFSPEWRYWAVLVLPNFKISTRWAYSQLKFGLTSERKSFIFNGQKIRDIRPEQFSLHFVNEFEAVVFGRYPELAELKKFLRDQGAFFTSMSGTGSALYGLFLNEDAAREARRSLQNRVRTELVRPIDQVEYNKLMQGNGIAGEP